MNSSLKEFQYPHVHKREDERERDRERLSYLFVVNVVTISIGTDPSNINNVDTFVSFPGIKYDYLVTPF